MKYQNILMFFALVAVIIFGVKLSISEDERFLDKMSRHKSLVENEYKNNKFNLNKIELDSGSYYKIHAEGNKIVLKYNGLAAKGKQWITVTLNAKNNGNGFEWSCVKDYIFYEINC